jgi:hypothetical protein
MIKAGSSWNTVYAISGGSTRPVKSGVGTLAEGPLGLISGSTAIAAVGVNAHPQPVGPMSHGP